MNSRRGPGQKPPAEVDLAGFREIPNTRQTPEKWAPHGAWHPAAAVLAGFFARESTPRCLFKNARIAVNAS
jgi:hypothetical protein